MQVQIKWWVAVSHVTKYEKKTKWIYALARINSSYIPVTEISERSGVRKIFKMITLTLPFGTLSGFICFIVSSKSQSRKSWKWNPWVIVSTGRYINSCVCLDQELLHIKGEKKKPVVNLKTSLLVLNRRLVLFLDYVKTYISGIFFYFLFQFHFG